MLDRTAGQSQKYTTRLYLDVRDLAGALQNELTTTVEAVEDGGLEEVDTLLRYQPRHTASKRFVGIAAFHGKTQLTLEVVLDHILVLHIGRIVVEVQMRISRRVPHLFIDSVHNSVEFLGQSPQCRVQAFASLDFPLEGE